MFYQKDPAILPLNPSNQHTGGVVGALVVLSAAAFVFTRYQKPVKSSTPFVGDEEMVEDGALIGRWICVNAY